MDWLYLDHRDDPSRINEGVNVRLLDYSSYFEGGILSRCIRREGDIYTFVGPQGFAFLLEEDSDQRKEMIFPLRITLDKSEGAVMDGSWNFDSHKTRRIEGTKDFVPTELAEYHLIVKEMERFANSLPTKQDLQEFLFKGKIAILN